jgi:pSer/pThr/pTyr-binding forkhead associated (FHA) protein
MKLEVRYPTGAKHQVRLPGPLAVLGRDPSCDLVLNDAKCSRRHAVVEVGLQGLSVRDTGSANGVFVNGKKVERRRLLAGDTIRLGDVILKVLEEEVAGTVVMAPEELHDLETDLAPPGSAAKGGAGATPPSPALGTGRPAVGQAFLTPRPPPTAGRARTETDGQAVRPGPEPVPRPLTVSVLAGLWAAFALASAVGGLGAAAFGGLPGLARAGAVVAALLGAALGAVMAFGLWRRAPWARVLQVGFAALGLLGCPLTTLAAGATLAYMLRREARLHFSGGRARGDLAPEEAAALRDVSAEAAFAFAILATLVLGSGLTVLAAWLLRR